MLQRRAVLAAISSVLATAVVPINALASDRRTRRDRLAGLLGQTFGLADLNGKVTQAQLVAFDDGPHCHGLEQFSVVFESGDLTDGLYEAFHPGSGKLLVSLMPSGQLESDQNQKRAYFSYFV